MPSGLQVLQLKIQLGQLPGRLPGTAARISVRTCPAFCGGGDDPVGCMVEVELPQRAMPEPLP